MFDCSECPPALDRALPALRGGLRVRSGVAARGLDVGVAEDVGEQARSRPWSRIRSVASLWRRPWADSLTSAAARPWRRTRSSSAPRAARRSERSRALLDRAPGRRGRWVALAIG